MNNYIITYTYGSQQTSTGKNMAEAIAKAIDPNNIKMCELV